MALRIAHAVVVTPGRCGLYETTHELVVELRLLGVDSRMYDPSKERTLHPGGEHDRGAPFCEAEWANKADLLCNHSGLGELHSSKVPVLHCAHGRPHESILTEAAGGPPVYSYHYERNKDPRFKGVITFWPEHVDMHEIMWPDTPVYTVQAPCDLKVWSPDGPNTYDFGGKKGDINVVCTDSWRKDVDLFGVINAFALFAREHRGAKLHLYATPREMKGWSALLRTIQDRGNLGEIKAWVKDLANIYRAADLLITPHRIATRSIREALACGCPIAQMDHSCSRTFVKQMEKSLKIPRTVIRQQAEKLFDSKKTGRDFLKVVGRILENKKAA